MKNDNDGQDAAVKEDADKLNQLQLLEEKNEQMVKDLDNKAKGEAEA